MNKKVALPLLILCLLLIFVACTPATGTPTAGDSIAPAKSAVPSATATDTPAENLAMPVIHPDQVLSEAEASDIVGIPVTIDQASTKVDKESGISSMLYGYTLSESTDVFALVQIEQDGLKPASDLAEGSTARSPFDDYAKLLQDESTPVEDLGDAAFTIETDGQLFIAYKGYFILVAFTKDEYDSSKNVPLNIDLGRKIMENMQR